MFFKVFIVILNFMFFLLIWFLFFLILSWVIKWWYLGLNWNRMLIIFLLRGVFIYIYLWFDYFDFFFVFVCFKIWFFIWIWWGCGWVFWLVWGWDMMGVLFRIRVGIVVGGLRLYMRVMSGWSWRRGLVLMVVEVGLVVVKCWREERERGERIRKGKEEFF